MQVIVDVLMLCRGCLGAINDVSAPDLRRDLESDQVTLADPAFHDRVIRCMELEIGIPVGGPGRQQEYFCSVRLEKHLLETVLAVAAIVLIWQIVIPFCPESREFQVGILSRECVSGIFFGDIGKAKHGGLDGVL